MLSPGRYNLYSQLMCTRKLCDITAVVPCECYCDKKLIWFSSACCLRCSLLPEWWLSDGSIKSGLSAASTSHLASHYGNQYPANICGQSTSHTLPSRSILQPPYCFSDPTVLRTSLAGDHPKWQHCISDLHLSS